MRPKREDKDGDAVPVSPRSPSSLTLDLVEREFRQQLRMKDQQIEHLQHKLNTVTKATQREAEWAKHCQGLRVMARVLRRMFSFAASQVVQTWRQAQQQDFLLRKGAEQAGQELVRVQARARSHGQRNMQHVVLRMIHRETAAAVITWHQKLETARKRAKAARLMKQAAIRMVNREKSDTMMGLKHHAQQGKEYKRRGMLLRRVLGRVWSREVAMSWAELHRNWQHGVAEGAFGYVQQLRAAVDSQRCIHLRQVQTLKHELSILTVKHQQLILENISAKQRPAIAEWYHNYRTDLASIWEHKAKIFKAQLDSLRATMRAGGRRTLTGILPYWENIREKGRD